VLQDKFPTNRADGFALCPFRNYPDNQADFPKDNDRDGRHHDPDDLAPRQKPGREKQREDEAATDKREGPGHLCGKGIGHVAVPVRRKKDRVGNMAKSV